MFTLELNIELSSTHGLIDEHIYNIKKSGTLIGTMELISAYPKEIQQFYEAPNERPFDCLMWLIDELKHGYVWNRMSPYEWLEDAFYSLGYKEEMENGKMKGFDGNIGYLSLIEILPEHTGKGYFRELIKLALYFFSKRNVDMIALQPYPCGHLTTSDPNEGSERLRKTYEEF